MWARMSFFAVIRDFCDVNLNSPLVVGQPAFLSSPPEILGAKDFSRFFGDVNQGFLNRVI
jgi:hypothetical protein